MVERQDHLERRCPKLGSSVSFKYCRVLMDRDIPCSKIFDCWWEFFDIKGYLKEILSTDVYEKLVKSQPKPKVLSIIEMIEEAKKRQK